MLGNKKDLKESLKNYHGGYCVVCYSDFENFSQIKWFSWNGFDSQCGH